MGPESLRDRASAASISIHPSRVGWDFENGLSPTQTEYFNPPIPCGMGLCASSQSVVPSVFQSTHPVWDGTYNVGMDPEYALDFNPPIPCGMGLRCLPGPGADAEFQSTHPVWDGTSQ